jgi:hypothetical protein
LLRAPPSLGLARRQAFRFPLLCSVFARGSRPGSFPTPCGCCVSISEQKRRLLFLLGFLVSPVYAAHRVPLFCGKIFLSVSSVARPVPFPPVQFSLPPPVSSGTTDSRRQSFSRVESRSSWAPGLRSVADLASTVCTAAPADFRPCADSVCSIFLLESVLVLGFCNILFFVCACVRFCPG